MSPGVSFFFAFDPSRAAILLVGGNKQGDKRWYRKHLPIADARFRRHLEGLVELLTYINFTRRFHR